LRRVEQFTVAGSCAGLNNSRSPDLVAGLAIHGRRILSPVWQFTVAGSCAQIVPIVSELPRIGTIKKVFSKVVATRCGATGYVERKEVKSSVYYTI
jgi:hypothetical protein